MLSDSDKDEIYSILQGLIDEGWDMGQKYGEIKDANSDIRMKYWTQGEEYERELVQQAIDRVVALFSRAKETNND